MEEEEEEAPPPRVAAARPALALTAACCHGGAKMAVLAYSLGKREINQHFTIKNAKLISLAVVILLIVFHTASRHYGGKWCPVNFSYRRRSQWNTWHPLLLTFKLASSRFLSAGDRNRVLRRGCSDLSVVAVKLGRFKSLVQFVGGIWTY